MKIVEILATLGTIAGYFAISLGILKIGFVLSAFSQILWLVWAYDCNARGIMVVNACLLLSSVNGMLR